MWRSTRRRTSSSTPSTAPASRPARPTTARRARGRNTARTTTARSCATRTATASKRSTPGAHAGPARSTTCGCARATWRRSGASTSRPAPSSVSTSPTTCRSSRRTPRSPTSPGSRRPSTSISRSAPTPTRRSTASTARRSTPATRTTARPASALPTTPATTARSSWTLTATTSRRSITNRPRRAGHRLRAVFRVAVPQAVLDDLARRLEHARWPEAYALDGGEDPARLDRIGGLLERWRGGYDWRAHEARINEHEQALVDGLHVLKAGRGPRLVLMNGWPSTLVEYLPALPLLTGFEVWIVSRLGYGFSDHGLDQPGDDEHAAKLVGRVLGAGRYAAHGDDFGGSVLSRLALQRPEQVAALHVGEWLEDLDAPDLTPAERAYVDGVNRWREDERGYGHVQANRPQTLGLALGGRPPRGLARVADQWLSWSAPDCPLDDDLILTTATIYWVTRTLAPSMRAYAADSPPPRGKVPVPAAITAGKEDRPPPPREWLERSYADLRDVRVLERGGHFWAAETPEQFADRLKTFLAEHARL